MIRDIKHTIQLIILTSILILLSNSKVNAQEVKLIDNKGTIKTVNNTRVFTGSANKPANADAVIGDIYFDQYPNPNSVEVWDGASWKDIKNNITHTGTTGSIFFADLFGVPSENNPQLFWDNINNRLGIGTDSPTHKFHVTGATRTEGILNSDGTAGEPSYRFTDDTDTGIYSPLQDEIAITAGGVEAMHIDETSTNTTVTINETLKLNGKVLDINNFEGTAGQILSSTATGTDWIDNTKNSVTTNNTGIGPANPIENDVWFDTLNSEIKIYDVADGWKLITSTSASNNIYTADGTLTSNRTVDGGDNLLYFNNNQRVELYSRLSTIINSTGGSMQIFSGTSSQIFSGSSMQIHGGTTNAITSGFNTLISAGTTLRISAGSGITIQSPTKFDSTILDVNNLPGATGQTLTSTNTGVEWRNNAALTPGDIKQGIQTINHNGWYLLNGASIATLPANAQTNAATLGLVGNLPDATNRVLKSTDGSQALASIGGQPTTTLTQNNLPNVNFTGNTTTDGDHNHNINGTNRGANNIVFSGFNTYNTNIGTTNTSNNGSHNHSVTVNSGGSNQSFNRYQPYLVVNTFIYLGL